MCHGCSRLGGAGLGWTGPGRAQPPAAVHTALSATAQGLKDISLQRGDPDERFEYCTTSVSCQGAEIQSVKVFWMKSKQALQTHFCVLRIFEYTKAVR